MLRLILLQRKAPQSKWRLFLPELVFSLNTSVSTATKCIPYNFVFSRSACLPIEALFNHDKNHLKDVSSPADYAEDRSFIRKDIAVKNLQLNSKKMQTHYNKNIRLHDYRNGDKVCLNLKYYKTGETRKPSPHHHGPLTVLRKLPNGTNFEIVNNGMRKKKIEDLTPFKEATSAEYSGSNLEDQHHSKE